MFLVIQNGKYQEINEELNLKGMQNWVGIPGESAYIEVVRNQFSDPYIDLVCDEEFLFKGLAPTCMCPQTGSILHGVVLAVGCQMNEDGAETVGLTPEQVQIVKAELPVVTEIIGNTAVFGIGER